MKYKYIGDPRVYPHLALEVEAGDIVELEEMPNDGRWEEDSQSASASAVPAELDSVQDSVETKVAG